MDVLNYWWNHMHTIHSAQYNYSISMEPVKHGVISLCLWSISPTDFASFPIKFVSFPQKIASSSQQFVSYPQQIASFPPKKSLTSPTLFCGVLPKTKTQFYKEKILNNLFSGNCWPMCPVIVWVCAPSLSYSSKEIRDGGGILVKYWVRGLILIHQ